VVTPATPSVLVIGEIFVDYHLDLRRVRLGGIAHAGRALGALGARWAAGYFAPRYLESACRAELSKHGVGPATMVGETLGAPNLIVIRDSPEAGSQGYDDVLRDARSSEVLLTEIEQLIRTFVPDHILVFPGAYPLETILEACKDHPISIDAQYSAGLATILASTEAHIETVFCSTSSTLFREEAKGSFEELVRLIPSSVAQDLILKENRGGSRVIGRDDAAVAGAYLGATVHSVGVGDCFDVVWIVGSGQAPALKLNRASYIAQLYASTQDDAEWQRLAEEAAASDSIVALLRGKRLGWEDRPNKKVYIAAPDFPDVETSALDDLEEALRYHNFDVVRPIAAPWITHRRNDRWRARADLPDGHGRPSRRGLSNRRPNRPG
jgi:hypothetical protein